MGLSAREAAKETGKAVTTITRAIDNGKMSATRLDGGGYDIDPAELFRVFRPKGSATPEKLHNATPENVGATGVLDLEIKMLRDMLAREQDTVADLRTRLDAAEEGRAREAEERRKLTAMITHQAQMPAPAPTVAPERVRRSWWPWGRAND